MSRTRVLRALGHTVRLALFVLVSVLAAQFLINTLTQQGWTPGALFGLLLVTGAISLVWRAALDLRKAIRRLRA